MFNIDNGYLEGLCRGFKNGILKQADYLNLVQCETLDGKDCSCVFNRSRDFIQWNISQNWVHLVFTAPQGLSRNAPASFLLLLLVLVLLLLILYRL